MTLIEIMCINCGKTFTVEPYRKTTVRYCSTYCGSEYRSHHLKCEWCGSSFKRPKSNVKSRYKHSFCSSKCYHNWTIVSEEHRKEMARESVKRYRKEHPGWYRNIKAKRRGLAKNLGGNFTDNEWRELKDRYDYTCLRCGKKEPEIKLTVDHIVSLNRWIRWKLRHQDIQYQWNDIENIQPLCQSCNSIKNDKNIDFKKKI